MNNETNNLNNFGGVPETNSVPTPEPVATPVEPVAAPTPAPVPTPEPVAAPIDNPVVEEMPVPEAPAAEKIAAPTMTEQFQQQQASQQPVNNEVPAGNATNDQPISMWGYIGYDVLFMIPCVGLIALLILAFGNKNQYVKTYARAKLVLMVIAVVVSTVLTFVAGAAIASIISGLLGN